MNRYEYGRRYRSRHRRRTMHRVAAAAGCVALIGICAAGAIFFGRNRLTPPETKPGSAIVIQPELPAGETQSPEAAAGTEASAEVVIPVSPAASLLNQAERLAAGYDYDSAIALLQNDAQYASEPEVLEAISRYEAAKAALVPDKSAKLPTFSSIRSSWIRRRPLTEMPIPPATTRS